MRDYVKAKVADESALPPEWATSCAARRLQELRDDATRLARTLGIAETPTPTRDRHGRFADSMTIGYERFVDDELAHRRRAARDERPLRRRASARRAAPCRRVGGWPRTPERSSGARVDQRRAARCVCRRSRASITRFRATARSLPRARRTRRSRLIRGEARAPGRGAEHVTFGIGPRREQ